MTRHGRLAGHTTSVVLHAPLALQSITHTPCASHVPAVQPCSQAATAALSPSLSGGGASAGCPAR
jgi:hypothetical protein